MITEYLSQYRDVRVIYVPNPGNAGDSVIAAATYQVLDRIGVRYELQRAVDVDPTDRVILYGGGGNMVGPDTFSARVANDLHRHCKRFVILPHTIKDNDRLLGQFGENVDIFCRERYSFEYVQSCAQQAQVFLADDMAFSLDLHELESFANVGMLRQFVLYSKNKLAGKISTPMWSNLQRAARRDEIVRRLKGRASLRHLNCFRLDGERTEINIPLDNIDLSQELQFGVENADLAKFCAATLIEFLSGYKSVSTNRLHVAISAALIGMNVDFHSNSYYKCRGVYEFSMKHRFPNVFWKSGDQGLAD